MTNIEIYYPNMPKTYAQCPLMYKYKYIDKITMPQLSSWFEKGKKIHALANFYLKGQDITKLEQNLSYAEKEIFENLKNNPYFQKEYVNSEYNLSAKLDEYWLSGRLDALMKDENGYYILDYKTGSAPKNPEYDFQTMFYLTILNIFLSEKAKPENLNFVYIDLKNNQNIVIKFNETLKKEYSQIILSICKKIKEDTLFLAKKDERCAFCEYSKICRG